MRGRIKELIDHIVSPRTPWAEMETLTGISRDKWVNHYRGRQRANDEMIGKLGELWPQYSYWLMTGRTDEKNGHTSPTLERIARDIKSIEPAPAGPSPD